MAPTAEFRTPLLAPVLLLASLSVVQSQFPVPHAYPGFVFGPQPKESVAVLEAFFDLTCPGCRAGWPVVKDTVKSYGSRIRLVLHPFILPFHHNSNFAARSIQAVGSINASLAFDWLDVVFANQDEFSTEATWQKTPSEVVTRLATLVQETLGIDTHRFLDVFEHPEIDVATRVAFKYGCLRAIIQTPSYFVNGVPVRDADDSWTVEDWQAFLNPIIGGVGGTAAADVVGAGIGRKGFEFTSSS